MRDESQALATRAMSSPGTGKAFFSKEFFGLKKNGEWFGQIVLPANTVSEVPSA